MSEFGLTVANALADATLHAARERALAPLAVVVLDAGGHDIVVKREDGTGILRVEIARGKAWGALGMGLGSRDLAQRAERNPRFFAALAAGSGGRVIPNPGGVLIRDASRRIVGAIGVSGDAADSDEACALASIAASGFIADPGAS